MNSKGVDQTFYTAQSDNGNFRGVGISDEEVTKLMGKVKPAPPRIDRAVYQCDSHILNLDACRIPTFSTNVERKG